MAATPLAPIPEEPTAAPTPPPSPTPAPAAAPTPANSPTPARVTADPPQTKPAKNAGRVASGKRLAERNRLAREAKKKAQTEAASTSASTSASTTASSSTTSDNSSGEGLSLLTLLGIGGLLVSAAGVYYQHEAIQARFRSTPPAPPLVQAQTQAPAPAPSRIPVKQGGIKKME